MEMTAKTNILERKAWSRILSDGLMDLYLGVVFANVAAWMVATELGTENGITSVAAFGVLLVMLAAFRQAKARITEPRVGYFKIAGPRVRKVNLVGYVSVAITVALVAVTFVAGLTGVPEGLPFETALFLVPAAQMTLLMGLAAYHFSARRYYVYAALAALGYIGSEVLAVTHGVSRGWDIVGMFGLPALAMVPSGIVLLRSFLRAYPLPEENADA